MAVQILPIFLFYSMRKVSVWILIAYFWVKFMRDGIERVYALLFAMIIAKILLSVLSPVSSIIFKWIVIGRYRVGKYPLWGSIMSSRCSMLSPQDRKAHLYYYL
jgi:hypothetical protein